MFHLVCVHEFHGVKKGTVITDPVEVAKHLNDRGHHFVKITAPAVQPVPVAE